MSESSWSTEGVRTESIKQDPVTKVYDVVCRSTHLTSFAVLLDVNNVLSVRQPEKSSRRETVEVIVCNFRSLIKV